MKTLLWLDDIRDPNTNDWLNFSAIPQPYKVVWVKDYSEFVKLIESSGLPDGINFDHDLSDLQAFTQSFPDMSEDLDTSKELTGMDCAKWLVNYCIDNNKDLPKWYTHSANPIGKENIDRYLTSFLINS